jgi:hypothetical protein
MIRRISKTSFKVRSYARPDLEYLVTFENGISLCTCPDFIFRRLQKCEDCKHITKIKQEYPDVLDIRPEREECKGVSLSSLLESPS